MYYFYIVLLFIYRHHSFEMQKNTTDIYIKFTKAYTKKGHMLYNFLTAPSGINLFWLAD